MSVLIQSDKQKIWKILSYASGVMKRPTRIDIPFIGTFDLHQEVEKLNPVEARIIVNYAKEVLKA